MGKRTAWIYAGLPHTGGPAVAEAAAAHAATLAAHGIGLPATSSEQLRRAATELLRDHREQGLSRRDVEGTWARVSRRAWREGRTCLVGDERLAAADTDQVSLLLDGLTGLRPRVVLALRDPAALLVAGWAAEVRAGRATTLERYAERVLDPEAEHPQAERFRATHDVAGLLDRWTAAVGSECVHVVVLPPAGDPGAALWRELLGLLGVDPPPVVPGDAGVTAAPETVAGATVAGTTLAGTTVAGTTVAGTTVAGTTVAGTTVAGTTVAGTTVAGTASAAGLREVNAALEGHLPREARRDLLSAWLPPVTTEDGAAAAALPPGLRAELAATAEKWRARVAEAGVPVRGELDDLVPAESTASPASPGTEPVGQALAWVSRALGEASLEVTDLRGRVAELERRNARLERKRDKLKDRLARPGG